MNGLAALVAMLAMDVIVATAEFAAYGALAKTAVRVVRICVPWVR